MAELLSIDNFLGMVADAPDGKQPQGTCKEIVNLVYDRERGSLTTRFTYENSISKPSGVTTLNHWLTFPTTYPSAQDNHIWFTDGGIFVRPYFHNSSTATDDWLTVGESKAVAITANPTVTGSPTNTIVMTGADTCTSLGLSTTANYYKNWTIKFDHDGIVTYWFVKSYSVASDYATFTLDHVIDDFSDATVTAGSLVSYDFTLYRHFHTGVTFSPAFTSPAGYATETAYRWSGGQGSTVGYKNIWSGYVDRNFFNTHQFTGTYVEQAECSAPASGILQSLSVADAVTTGYLITETKNYQFDSSTFDTDWVGVGSYGVRVTNDGVGNARMLSVNATTDGDVTTNNVKLGTGADDFALSTGTDYRLRIRYAYHGRKGDNLVFTHNGVTLGSISLTGTERNFSDDRAWADTFLDFTVASNATSTLKFFIDGNGSAPAGSLALSYINVFATSNDGNGISGDKTYSFYATYLYDGFQESELTYLGRTHLTKKWVTLKNILQLRLGELNKRVSTIRLYVAIDEKDTTISSNTARVSPAYLFREIAITSSSWALDTANGYYEYTDTYTKIDEEGLRFTWEQKTKRTASNSTTCSYSLACMASGRVFVAKDYDYYDAVAYYNRIRHTGFNGDGAPTPDIFPNIPDIAIKTITAGQSQEIRHIAEYEGDVLIGKKSSFLRLDTSNPDSNTWELLLIKNGIGVRSKYGGYKFDKGYFFADIYSAYLYDGYRITDVLKGRWKNLYQTLVTSDALASAVIVWYNPVNDTIALALGNAFGLAQVYYEFNTDSWLPVKMDNGSASTYRVGTVVTTSDGVIHFAPRSVGANALKISQSAGSNLVDVSINTGYYDVPKGKTGRPKWVYVLAESPLSAFTVSLYGMQPNGTETTILNEKSFTPTTTNKFLYKVQATEDVPCTMLKLTLAQTGAVAPSTKEMKIHKAWVDGDLVDEFTDSALLPS